jgi:hypothetical protein
MKRRIWTREELSEVFRINENGELERLIKGLDWRIIDCVDNSNGYCRVGYKGTMIQYHTIIWVLINGTIVDAEAVIDHISGNKLDNRIENLRLTTQRKNNQNKKSHRNGRLVGCRLHKCGKWEALIAINGKQISLGLFNTEPEASQVYLKALELIDQYIDSEQFRNLVKNS